MPADRRPVRVTSEIGRLRAVVCHTPGPELSVVTPDNQERYLFNDLLDLERAGREHGRFRAILKRFTTVLEVTALLREILEEPEGRAVLLGRLGDGIRDRAERAEPAEIVRLLVQGEETRGGSLAKLVNEAGYSLPPLPNLFFTRDAAAVLGDRVMISAMKHGVRWSEEILMCSLFAHHPALANAGVLYDGTVERRLNTSIEGGDVHVLRSDLLLVGLSERTTAAGIDALTEAVFRTGEFTDVLVVILPPHRTSIHLDMIFTMIDRELCCVYPPYFIGPTRLPVLHVSGSGGAPREKADLFSALRDLGLPLEPIFCGGEHRTHQDREQWGSGCNLLAVGPGQALAYERNEHTLAALARDGGFRIIPGDDLLAGGSDPAPEGRYIVTVEGSELVRGGGGPRCMTMPLLREPLG